MNSFDVIGRLTKDPELKYTTNGTAVATFNIAVNRSYKRDGQPDADFFRCQAWGKLAEVIANNLRKGRQAGFSGRFENNNFTKDDGTKVYDYVFQVGSMTFCGSKDDSGPSAAPSGGGYVDPGTGYREDDLPF
jgi:single-strand DNA-binding protein